MTSCLAKLSCFNKKTQDEKNSIGKNKLSDLSEIEKLRKTEDWVKSLSNLNNFGSISGKEEEDQDDGISSRRRSFPSKMEEKKRGSPLCGIKEFIEDTNQLFPLRNVVGESEEDFSLSHTKSFSSLSSSSNSNSNSNSGVSFSSSSSSLSHLRHGSFHGCPNKTSFKNNKIPVETLTLNLAQCSSLGLTVVGHVAQEKDCGLFVGSVKRGGAADASGKIHPGDLLIKINNRDISTLSNMEALQILREEAKTSKVLVISVGKYWNFHEEDPPRNKRNSRSGSSFSFREKKSPNPYYHPKHSHFSNHSHTYASILSNDEIYDQQNQSFDSCGRHSNQLNKMADNFFNPHDGLKLFTKISDFRSDLRTSRLNNTDMIHPCPTPPPPFSPSKKLKDLNNNIIYCNIPTQKTNNNNKSFYLKNKNNKNFNSSFSTQTFLGKELIDWITTNVSGFQGNRKEAFHYSTLLLKKGLIRKATNQKRPPEEIFNSNDVYMIDNINDF